MLTHLLDTSAWLAHLLREPGSSQVTELFTDPDHCVGICSVSLVELHARLKALGYESLFAQILERYRPLFESIVSVDEEVAIQATKLRQNAQSRLPALDAMIAAAASSQGATLVHRDVHFSGIDLEKLNQLVLPSNAT